MIDELAASVAHSAQLRPEQARQAVAAMLRFLAARLPSPLFGELQASLQAGAPPPDPAAAPPRDAGPPTGEPA